MTKTLSILACLGLTLAACAKSSPPLGAGGETNWLVRCSDDGACEQGACLCGVCVRECSAETACDGAFAGHCVVTSSGAGEALCAAETQAVPAHVCLPRCAADADCGAGFDCLAATCVPEVASTANPEPIDAGHDVMIPDAARSHPVPVVDAGHPVPDGGWPDASATHVMFADAGSPLGNLAQSLQNWTALVAEMGDLYSYAEENCLVNAPTHTVTTVQVVDGKASLFGTTDIPTSECMARVNNVETFQPRSMPELYAECMDLVVREGGAVTLAFDDRNVIRACMWPGADTCEDNCGEGFYLRAVTFGRLEVP